MPALEAAVTDEANNRNIRGELEAISQNLLQSTLKLNKSDQMIVDYSFTSKSDLNNIKDRFVLRFSY